MGKTAKVVKQQRLDGMQPKKIQELEDLGIAWADAIRAFKEASSVVTEAKRRVREFVAKHPDIELDAGYFVEGYGHITKIDPKEWDVKFKWLKRDEKSTEEEEHQG